MICSDSVYLTLWIFFLPTVGAARIRDQTEAVQKVELQLSRKLVHRQGKPVVPHMMTQPTKEQQSGGQQAEVGQTGALRGLENIKTSSPHEQIIIIKKKASTGELKIAFNCAAYHSYTAGRGEIP